MNLGVYIHIPFCLKKCNYCDFVSFKKRNVSGYFDSLYKEILLYSEFLKERKIDSVFIGGGTPSCVEAPYIGKILSAFNTAEDCEITIESNPKTLTEEKLKSYLDYGINRISIGMQSMNDNELKLLGRIHNSYDFLKSYEMVVKTGFKNINIDTMFGIPDQTCESFEHTLYEVKKLNPAHISCYSLIIEEGTAFYNAKLNLPDEDSERRMYEQASKILENYNRYEISNYAQPGFECRHNLKYWKLSDYLGLGLNSHSFIKDKRFFNTSSMEKYISLLSDGKYPVEEMEEEEPEELLKDLIITGLRLSEGINLKEVNKKFGIDFLTEYKTVTEKYIDAQMLEIKNGNLRFTEKGISVSNYILSDFI